MKTDIVGLIYTGEHKEGLRDLTRVRSVAALPLLGRYRLIDFMLSNMVNSGIRNVGVILQKNYHSLMDQLGSGRAWDLHGKRAGMTLLPPFASSDHNGDYAGLLDALKCNMSFLRRSKERYIVVTDTGMLYAVHYEDVLRRHLETGADMTLIYSKERDARRNGTGRYLGLDEDGRVCHLEFDPVIPRYENTFTGAFLVRREMLIDMVDRATSKGLHHFTREMLVSFLREGTYKICGYEVPGKLWLIDSVKTYFNANMDGLDPEKRAVLFEKDRPVWTKLRDEMPTRYADGAKVTNSILGDGCVIEGTVENCVIFSGVTVHAGARVRGCVLMHDVVIGRNAVAENCILDRRASLRDDGRLIAPADYPIVVEKNLNI